MRADGGQAAAAANRRRHLSIMADGRMCVIAVESQRGTSRKTDKAANSASGSR